MSDFALLTHMAGVGLLVGLTVGMAVAALLRGRG